VRRSAAQASAFVRERWFGATGRLVPEIAVEGDLDVEGALVLADVSDEAALKEAHEQGRPVVVRAQTPVAVKTALARPEVASVLVPEDHRELLELDLTELTYG
jgi:aminoglycoside/choline kinase family phosphotransferase